MDDISTLDEANDLLAQDELSIADMRRLLLFLVTQCAEERRVIASASGSLIAMVELLLPIVERFAFASAPDADFSDQVLRATIFLGKLRDSMKADLVLRR